MKNLAVILFLIICIGASARLVAAAEANFPAKLPRDNGQVAAPTLIPTVSPAPVESSPTPESRVLPAVGSNVGLVIGASVLVLIIIGGVLGARRREKH